MQTVFQYNTKSHRIIHSISVVVMQNIVYYVLLPLCCDKLHEQLLISDSIQQESPNFFVRGSCKLLHSSWITGHFM